MGSPGASQGEIDKRFWSQLQEISSRIPRDMHYRTSTRKLYQPSVQESTHSLEIEGYPSDGTNMVLQGKGNAYIIAQTILLHKIESELSVLALKEEVGGICETKKQPDDPNIYYTDEIHCPDGVKAVVYIRSESGYPKTFAVSKTVSDRKDAIRNLIDQTRRKFADLREQAAEEAAKGEREGRAYEQRPIDEPRRGYGRTSGRVRAEEERQTRPRDISGTSHSSGMGESRRPLAKGNVRRR